MTRLNLKALNSIIDNCVAIYEINKIEPLAINSFKNALEGFKRLDKPNKEILNKMADIEYVLRNYREKTNGAH